MDHQTLTRRTDLGGFVVDFGRASFHDVEVSTHSTIAILVGYSWSLAFDALENATRVATLFSPRIFARWRTLDYNRSYRRLSLGRLICIFARNFLTIHFRPAIGWWKPLS